MIVDTSAVIAVAFNEPDAETLNELLLADSDPKMSTATAVELGAVVLRRLPAEDRRRLERLFALWELHLVPLTIAQSDIAIRAYRDYGRGSGHRAALNLGDCFSYALAYETQQPLLYVGDDFVHTDITSAYRPHTS